MRISSTMNNRFYLVCSMCVVMFFLFAFTAHAQSLPGDVNNNGTVDIVDALLIAQYYVGLNLPVFNTANADTNCSGSIDIIDALLVAQYYVGILPQFPCGSTPEPTGAAATPGVIVTLPNRATVLSKMELANNYYLSKYPAPDAKPDASHTGDIWTKATYLEGVMALYRTNNNSTKYNYAVSWATAFNWNARSGNKTTNSDDQCCMQTYCELYQISQEAARLANVTTCMDNICSLSSVSYWTWVDAIHMAMPVFAKIGAIKNDTKYFNRMYTLFNYTKSTLKLYNTTDHLWWRDSSFDSPYTTPNGKQCYWSRGNGWVFAALTRVLDVLPSSDSHRAEYLATFTEMADALKACQRTDGFWNPSLVDPNDYGGKETSGTSLFTYGMAWGVNKGILDSATYLPCIQKAWDGTVNDALHANGFLAYVQATGKQPSDGQPITYNSVPDFEDFGYGTFLLAGSEVYKLAPVN